MDFPNKILVVFQITINVDARKGQDIKNIHHGIHIERIPYMLRFINIVGQVKQKNLSQ
jgi:hypothetical protein